MLEIGRLLLSLYEDAQHTPVADFVATGLGKIRTVLPFDSAGIASLNISSTGMLEYTGGHAVNISPVEKLKGRLELNTPPARVIPGRGMVSFDPLFDLSFNNPGRSHFITMDSRQEQKFLAYAKKTEALNAMCMMSSSKANGVHSISLWRARESNEYCEADSRLADVLLPHLICAMDVNRTSKVEHTVSQLTLPDPVICYDNGFINFIHPDALKLLQATYAHWSPPFLPKVIWDGVRCNSQMRYETPKFIARAKLLDDLVIIYFHPKFSDNRLTKSEREVATLLANGATYKEAAAELGNSVSTIRNQAHSIYGKLKVDRKAGLAAALQRQGQSEN